MNAKTKNLLMLAVAAAWLALAVWCWTKPAAARSDAERRKLQQMPELSGSSLASGSFMTGFERYTQDQFPQRDGFRTVKAVFSLYGLRKLDNNGIYIAGGSAAKIIYPLSEEQLTRAAEKLTALYGQYLSGTTGRVVFAAVPDKGNYLAEKSGHLTLDFAQLQEFMWQNTPWAAHVDLTDTLDEKSYYRTDTHWRQDKLLPAAARLADALGAELAGGWTAVTADTPFYGVYYGQSALPLRPDTITYLTSDVLDGCTVFSYETNEETGVYDLEKLAGRDPYDVFLSGAAPLLRIDNPAQENGRTLIIFRDSFGSSLAPLLVPSYSTVYLADTRYLAPELIGQYVDLPADADALFLYSTLLLNESAALK